MSAPIEIDARGHKCPVPSLKLRKAMAGQAPGVRYCLLASDPMARIDVPFLMQDIGGRVVEIEVVAEGLRIIVETGDGQPD